MHRATDSLGFHEPDRLLIPLAAVLANPYWRIVIPEDGILQGQRCNGSNTSKTPLTFFTT